MRISLRLLPHSQFPTSRFPASMPRHRVTASAPPVLPGSLGADILRPALTAQYGQAQPSLSQMVVANISARFNTDALQRRRSRYGPARRWSGIECYRAAHATGDRPGLPLSSLAVPVPMSPRRGDIVGKAGGHHTSLLHGSASAPSPGLAHLAHAFTCGVISASPQPQSLGRRHEDIEGKSYLLPPAHRLLGPFGS